jgi:hypothetical protein
MAALGSIFFEFNLPNGTTWFYFSLLLAIALFFKFSRLLSVRNWDVLTLFLLVPGLLLLQEARPNAVHPEKHPATAVTNLVGCVAAQAGMSPLSGLAGVVALDPVVNPSIQPSRKLWFGYLWLLLGSAYFLIRCLMDLVLVRRPALRPNLNFSGLAWLGGTLFCCLAAVAFRSSDRQANASAEDSPAQTPDSGKDVFPSGTVGKESAPLELAQRSLEPNFWVQRGFAIFCHLLVVSGLILIGCRHFGDAIAGMAAATFYLMLPYTGLHVGQVQHVWPVALIVWTVAVYRLPTFAGLLLGLAAGTVYFPALLFPVWLSFYSGRGAGRFLMAFVLSAGLCLGVTGLLLWMDGELARTVQSALALSDWQPWKVPTAEGFWTGVHWAYRIPVFIAYLAFILATLFWPSPKNLAQVLALSAAALIGVQFWYADQGGVYILWYLPLLLLLVFRPNLSERRPPPIQSESDWLAGLGRALGRLLGSLVKVPEPLTPVR